MAKGGGSANKTYLYQQTKALPRQSAVVIGGQPGPAESQEAGSLHQRKAVKISES